MSEQGDLFSPHYPNRSAAAHEAAEAAIARVEANAEPRWLDVARRVVLGFDRGETFTTDDVWRVLDTGTVGTGDPRAMGAVMRSLQRDAAISNTRTYRPSERVECHGRPVAVWRRT